MSRRIKRINQLIRKELSEMLQTDLNDPNLDSFVSINEVDTAPDLKTSKIYVGHISGDADKEAILESLKKASGFLRKELYGRISLRYIPELKFYWDNTIEQGVHLMDVFESMHKNDEGKGE